MSCCIGGGIIGCFRQCILYTLYHGNYYLTSEIDFCKHIQTSRIAVQNPVNIVTNDNVFIFTSENPLNTMTIVVCTESKHVRYHWALFCWNSTA